MKEKINGMYGWVKFVDGSEIDLCANNFEEVRELVASLVTKKGLKVVDIGQSMIGNEAHWLIQISERDIVFDTNEKVEAFISDLEG